MMKQLKIGKKLFVLVASLLVSMLVVAGASLVLMYQISNASMVVSRQWLPLVIEVEDMNNMVAGHRILEMEYILAGQSSQKLLYANQISGKRLQLADVFERYQAQEWSAEAQTIVHQAQEQWNAYIQLSDQAMELSDQGQTEAATALVMGASREQFNSMADTFAQMVSGNTEGAQQASDAAGRMVRLSGVLVLGVLLVVALYSVLLSLRIVRMIVRPLQQIQAAAAAMDGGNLEIELAYVSRDEVGQIAQTFRTMSENMRAMIQEMQNSLGAMANGNFMLQGIHEERYIGTYQRLLAAMQQIGDTLSNTISRIGSVSDQVADGAEQVSNGAQALSQGATEQASAIEELSASIFEVSEQVKQNAEHAKQASGRADDAGRQLSSSNAQMQSMVGAMAEIDTKSSEISKIIKVIEDIAFQTNILALNAAVEAARAGTAGKGFAVVADEVRNLASKSAQAAQSTTRLIAETVESVQKGSEIAKSTAMAMQESAQETQRAVTLIDEIAQASEQQAQSIAQINVGVEQIASVVQTNSATAQESAAASEELSGQAHTLKQLISHFQILEAQQLDASAEVVLPEAKDSF